MTRRQRLVLQHVALAVLAYVPLLLTARGRVAADTKTYLYLDPSRLLSRAPSMWDPDVGLGTVTHQTIGYLWPMGPWFWSFEQLGVPDWVAQRLWVATLLFAAGAGVLHLLRVLGVARRLEGVALAAALVYAFSPYVLHYAARISVLLLPWAALPWLVALAQRSVRTGSWRHPATFALVVATVGGVNATALVLAGLGPLLWIPFAVLVHGEATVRDGIRAALRIGVLTLACSLWWIAGLAVQGSHGIDILRYTETVETVARTSLSSEVLRGLGYWFFYGGDKLGSWIEPGRSYTQHLWLIGLGFVLPAGALLAAVLVRWRYRAYFVGLVVLGTAVAVGAYPYHDPSPVGAVFKFFAGSSTAGLALRSTPRAVPLVVLGTALLIAAGLAALATRRPRAATAGAVVAGLVAAAGIPPLWTGDFIGENLQRPGDVPGYWHEAAEWLDAQGDETRVLEIPGTDFAAYRWGNTVDPILPGLMDRGYAARELIPYGTEGSADLLAALDRRLQEGVLDPAALAPVARLLGVGDIVLRSDLQYERYRTPRPVTLWGRLTDPTPPGLGRPEEFGERRPNRADPELPLQDEIFLGTPTAVPDPPPVAAFPVEDPVPIVRTRSASPLLLAGDGEGVVEAAAAGLLGDGRALRYWAALEPGQHGEALADGAVLLLTDTNRKRARRWSTVRENTGYTEQAGETPLIDDPADNRLPLFPDAPDEAYTTVEQRGVRSVQATDYGNPVSYTAEDRPANAFDGDTTTAWRTGAFDGVAGEELVLRTQEPVRAARVNVVQPVTGPRNRFITRLSVELDGEPVATFDLDERSRTPAGQDLELGSVREFSTLTLRVEQDNVGKRALYDGFSGVGLAEVRVADVRIDEVVVLPSSFLEGTDDEPLTILLSRLRADPREPVRSDEERTLVRSFSLPGERSFTLRGQARISAGVPDDAVDKLVGLPGGGAQSSRRLAGDLTARASAAVDGDPATAWTSGFGEQVGDWVEIPVPDRPIDRLALTLRADGFHSVPTRLIVSTDRGDRRTVDVPAIADGGERDDTATVDLEFAAVRGDRLRLTVDAVRPAITTDWFSGNEIAMPVSVAEIDLPGLDFRPAATGPLDTGCRDDLLAVDGEPVSVRITGTVDAAVRREGLRVESCGGEVRLGAGEHLVRTRLGLDTGFDVDRLVLTSGEAPPPTPAPRVEVIRSGATSFDLRVQGASEPFWLVLGQSNSTGWEADADGIGDLGTPEIVDGYANGWRIDPEQETFAVTLRWTPQRMVWAGLWLSLLAALACLVVAVAGWRRGPLETAPAPPPLWRRPWWATGPPVRLVPAVGLSVATGLVAGLVVHPLFGVGTALVALAALRLPRGRAVGAAGAGSLVLAALFTVAKQWRNGYPPDFGWADFFRPAHYLAWAAVWLVVVTVLSDRFRPSTDKSQGHPLDAHSPDPG